MKVKTESARRVFALNCIDILVLSAFAVAQPLFDLLARSAAFLVVHHSKPVDLLALVACAYAAPAGLLIALEWLAARIAPRSLGAVHLGVLGFLLSLDVLPIVRRAALPGILSLILAVAAGAGLAVAYARIRDWRWSLVYLTPVVLVFPVMLLFFSPASAILMPARAPKAVAAHVGNPVPVVLVVFDEFPLSSLLDDKGDVDRVLYPNFAELARTATFYRGTTTVGESTLLALPAILSGKCPDPKHPRLPDVSGYPNTLFTLLGGSYRLNVNENDTLLCPESLCGEETRTAFSRIGALLADAGVLWLYAVLPSDLTGRLPDVTQSWKDFQAAPAAKPTLDMWARFDSLADWHDRVQQFREFAASVRPSEWPTLHFLHILLPHAPWEYLPSGQKCVFPEARIPGLRGVNDRGEDPNYWTGDSWAVAQNYQRFLVQVGLVDRLVGSLLKDMRDRGIYDSSLVIITADHGASFRPRDSRRSVTATNHADIMSVPLFIKFPQQQKGGVDDRSAENIDILPTVLDVLKTRAGWKLDGHSLLGSPAPERRVKIIVTDAERQFEFPAGPDDLRASVARKIEMFGAGSWERLHALGDSFAWTGRPVPRDVHTEPDVTFELEREGYYSNVDLRAPMLVTNISGKLRRNGAAEGLALAVAVNGTVAGVTRSRREGGNEVFSALVPHTALRAGRNEVGVFSIHSGTELGRIRRVSPRQFQWGTALRFAATGNAPAFFGPGWSSPEQDLTWTDGHVATLYLPVARPPHDVQLVANLSALTYGEKLPAQQVRVLVNRRKVAEWRVKAGFGEYDARIPRDYIGDAGLEITFELPDAAAPVALGSGSDSRTLGIAVTRLDLRI